MVGATRVRPSQIQAELLELMGFAADRVLVGPVRAKIMWVWWGGGGGGWGGANSLSRVGVCLP